MLPQGSSRRLVICIILFALNQHPEYPLILAANRDEFAERPSEGFHRWETEPTIYAGRDKLQGGTWLGLNESGELATVTNYREFPPTRDGLRSRGELPLLYLNGAEPDFSAYLRSHGASYGPVNLLWGKVTALHYWSNRGSGEVEKIDSGVHGLSNALLDTPWPKVERGKVALTALLAQQDVSAESLFKLLNDQTQAADSDLPRTGLPIEAERALSSIRIPLFEGYGSLTATVLRVAITGAVEVWERNYATGRTTQMVF